MAFHVAFLGIAREEWCNGAWNSSALHVKTVEAGFDISRDARAGKTMIRARQKPDFQEKISDGDKARIHPNDIVTPPSALCFFSAPSRNNCR